MRAHLDEIQRVNPRINAADRKLGFGRRRPAL